MSNQAALNAHNLNEIIRQNCVGLTSNDLVTIFSFNILELTAGVAANERDALLLLDKLHMRMRDRMRTDWNELRASSVAVDALNRQRRQ